MNKMILKNIFMGFNILINLKQIPFITKLDNSFGYNLITKTYNPPPEVIRCLRF